MNTPLISTKGTSKTSKISAKISLIFDVLFVIVIFSFFKRHYDSFPSYLQDDFLLETAHLIVFSVIIAGVLFVYTAFQFASCDTYIDIYENKVEGKGIQNLCSVQEFCLTPDKITNVTYRTIYLFIHTPSGKYTILTDAKAAKKVYEHFSH